MKKIFGLLLVLVFAFPLGATALTLNPSQQAQMNGVVNDLTQILYEIDAAARQGTAYLNSVTFAVQAQSISVRIRNIQAQVMSIFSSVMPTQQPGYNPTQPYNPYTQYPQQPQTQPQLGYSTATFRTIDSGSTATNVVTFSINAQPNTACSALGFTVDFGDGQTQPINFPASCGNQIQTLQHAYPATGTFTARLTSGNFGTTISITTPISSSNGGTVTLNQSQGTQSYQIAITVNAYPGPNCGSANYTLNFGDGQTQPLTFSAGCSSQVQTINHTYSGTGNFTVSVTDNTGKGPSMVVYPQVIIAAGVGDPQTVVQFLRSGTSTAIADESVYKHAVTNSGVVLNSTQVKVGTASLYFNGSSHLSVPGSSVLNLSSDNFTIAGWVRPAALPASGQQAAIAIQANAGAADSSVGGAGLELYNNGLNTQIAYVGNVGGTVRHPIYQNTLLSGTVSVNTWYHVAVVRTGSSLLMFLNGALTASTTVSGTANPSSNAFTLGRYGEYNGNYFNGYMVDFRLVKGRALWTNNFDPLSGVQTTSTTLPAQTCDQGGIGYTASGAIGGNCK